MTPRSGPVLEAALAGIARGWVPLPMAPRSKRPLLPWRDMQARGPDAVEVQAWYLRWPDAGLAFVTGAVSGLVVLDIDPAHGGGASLAEIEAREGALPETVEAETGGGGRHLYFAHPGGHLRNRVGLAPGIDIRGDGGIIVAPPSIHPNGRPYRWRAGCAPGDIPLAPLPAWLLGSGADDDRPVGHTRAYWRRLVAEGVGAGQRNSTVASLTGHLLWHGVDPEVALELMLAWNRQRCRPPLSDEEVARTVQSIERTHERSGGGTAQR